MKATLELRRPSLELYSEFLKFIEEMRSKGDVLWDPYLPAKAENPENFIQRQLDREVSPEAPLVPETIYWGVRDGAVVGRISLRHRLEGNLLKIGGHIGYEVRPSARRQGVVTEMLRLVLLTPQAQKIGKLLLTCSPKNLASNKTILANGGKLTQTIFVDLVQEERHHYWIEL